MTASANGRERDQGRIIRIAGPVVGAEGLRHVRLYDVVHVGLPGLIGEVIRLSAELATIQVYEETEGLEIGEPVYNSGHPLAVELGPGLLGTVYDGLQRPLYKLAGNGGAFLERGHHATPLENRRWTFEATVAPGTRVQPGDVLGHVAETANIAHRLLVPPSVSGELEQIASGSFKLDEPVATIAGPTQKTELTLRIRWPVRHERPSQTKLTPEQPLITGTRVIDTFFPIAKGGTAIIPGGFGTGKTVLEQSLARWSDVDVVVYIGCGERGNEMAEVLTEFPELEDPRNAAPLMKRTILIANTSNMPVAAREASIYTGITLGEYYRDMGYDVLLLADSTSRWAEALREISGRLEEMPGEEGFPAYLAARLAEFYERAGRVICQQGGHPREDDARVGSVTIVGAVSPPGGDFSEPVTQDSLRVAGAFWGLDYDLSRRRHFPAINWLRSYTLYEVDPWFAENVARDWPDLVRQALALLQREQELQEIVKLIGADTLADEQRAVLQVARMLREDFLQQSAYDPVDRYCPLPKTYRMLRVIMRFYSETLQALEQDYDLEKIVAMPITERIARMKELHEGEAVEALEQLERDVGRAFARREVSAQS